MRIEAADYTDKLRSSKNSEKGLKAALTKEIKYSHINAEGETVSDMFSIAFLYMSLIAKNSKTLLYNTETSQLRFLSSRHDELHLLFLQISEFLMFAELPSVYTSLLPTNPLHVLSRTFRLYPEQIFQTVRHSLKPLYQLTTEEYDTKVHEFKDVIDYHLEQIAKCKDSECSGDYFDEAKFLEEQKARVWNYITPELYMLFWYLQLSDIYCPENKYASSIKKLNQEDPNESQKKKSKDKTKKKSIQILKDEKVTIRKSIEEHEKYIQEMSKTLLLKIMTKNFQNIRVYFLQYCMYPRLMFSPRDAVYVVKFIMLLIKMRTPYFNVIGLIGTLLKEILPCILCCTEKESHNLGIFFLELFKTLKRWQNKSHWEKECDKTPGFDKNIVKESRDTISLKEFDKVIKAFNRKILGIVDICLKRDYMAARNAIIMLQKLSPMYPSSKDIITELEEHMKNLMNICKEDDLKTLANAYISVLQRKLRAMEPVKTHSRGQSFGKDDSSSLRKRENKYDAKSKSRERPRSSRRSNRGSTSPDRRDRSKTPSKYQRGSRSPNMRADKSSRSKSKDGKDHRKRSKH